MVHHLIKTEMQQVNNFYYKSENNSGRTTFHLIIVCDVKLSAHPPSALKVEKPL